MYLSLINQSIYWYLFIRLGYILCSVFLDILIFVYTVLIVFFLAHYLYSPHICYLFRYWARETWSELYLTLLNPALTLAHDSQVPLSSPASPYLPTHHTSPPSPYSSLLSNTTVYNKSHHFSTEAADLGPVILELHNLFSETKNTPTSSTSFSTSSSSTSSSSSSNNDNSWNNSNNNNNNNNNHYNVDTISSAPGPETGTVPPRHFAPLPLFVCAATCHLSNKTQVNKYVNALSAKCTESVTYCCAICTVVNSNIK